MSPSSRPRTPLCNSSQATAPRTLAATAYSRARRPTGRLVSSAARPRVRGRMTRFAPIAPPAARAGGARPDASIAVIASSGSAPASRIPRASTLTPRRADAPVTCSANPSAPAVSSPAPTTISAIDPRTPSSSATPPFSLRRRGFPSSGQGFPGARRLNGNARPLDGNASPLDGNARPLDGNARPLNEGGREEPSGQDRRDRKGRVRRQVQRGGLPAAGQHLGPEGRDHRAVVRAEPRAWHPHPDAARRGPLLGQHPQP